MPGFCFSLCLWTTEACIPSFLALFHFLFHLFIFCYCLRQPVCLEIHCVAHVVQVSLELMAVLPQPPEFWELQAHTSPVLCSAIWQCWDSAPHSSPKHDVSSLSDHCKGAVSAALEPGPCILFGITHPRSWKVGHPKLFSLIPNHTESGSFILYCWFYCVPCLPYACSSLFFQLIHSIPLVCTF